MLSAWTVEEKSGQRGASRIYSDIAIAMFETVKLVYRLAGRQTQGFLESVFSLMGLELSVPDHSSVSRRKRHLEVALPVVPREGAVHVA